MAWKLIDLTGKIFWDIVVLKYLSPGKNWQTEWLCKCICGKEWSVCGGKLKKGQTSCGCKRNVTHGLSHSKIYRARDGMKDRCNNFRFSTRNYISKGVTYDPAREIFENFYADMWPTYKEGLTLDRIDFTGNYCKENCRRLTIQAQQNNRSDNVRITHKGKKQTLPDWARELNIKQATLLYRVKHNILIDSPLNNGRTSKR